MTCSFCKDPSIETQPMSLCRTHAIEFYSGLLVFNAREAKLSKIKDNEPTLKAIRKLRFEIEDYKHWINLKKAGKKKGRPALPYRLFPAAEVMRGIHLDLLEDRIDARKKAS